MSENPTTNNPAVPYGAGGRRYHAAADLMQHKCGCYTGPNAPGNPDCLIHGLKAKREANVGGVWVRELVSSPQREATVIRNKVGTPAEYASDYLEQARKQDRRQMISKVVATAILLALFVVAVLYLNARFSR